MAVELWRKSASDLAGMIARKETTSTAVVEAHLARIAEVNPVINAVPVVLSEQALAGAAAADRAIAEGHAVGPFHGVPFTIKDNFLSLFLVIISTGTCLKCLNAVCLPQVFVSACFRPHAPPAPCPR